MAKFYGIIGFANTVPVETSPGVWVDEVTEASYVGDIVKNRRYTTYGENVNPDITISDTISIIASESLLNNISLMKYVKWRGATWAINNVIVERPRVLLEIGGLYNGPSLPS